MKYLDLNRENDYCIIHLHRGKANPINTDLVREISSILNRLQHDDTVRGVIWTGNTDGYFSVGLDLKELFYYDTHDISTFWHQWETMVDALISFPKPMIAAINGYSPAGGCVLALTCDMRVMADDPKLMIGLNELAVGIAVPDYIFLLYEFWLGSRLAYQSLMKARLFSPQEASRIGLIDELVPMDQVLSTAQRHLQQMLLASDQMLAITKRSMRRDLLRRLQAIPPTSQEEKLAQWFDPTSRAIMAAVVDRLNG